VCRNTFCHLLPPSSASRKKQKRPSS
jgi:hypothetical protein